MKNLATEATALLNNQQSVLPHPTPKKPLLSTQVETAIKDYLKNLGETPAANLLALVLAEIEPPLLKAVLMQTQFNRLQAAKIVGVSRTTFHKKLKAYGLEAWIETSKQVSANSDTPSAKISPIKGESREQHVQTM